MSDEGSEEKTLDASRRKLRKAREKGQVVTSRETVLSSAGIAGLLFLYLRRMDITEKLMALWTLDPEQAGETFGVQLQDKLAIIMDLAMQIVLPLTGLVIFVSVLTGLIVSGGPVFATQPLAPSFDKISPVAGFKRIFSMKALKTFAMHLIRLTVLTGIFGLILVLGWSVLIRAPICGLGCAAETLQAVVQPMVIAAVAVMAVMAIFDYLVSRSSFMKDQKMTMTEMKRELKDAMGDPHLRSHLRQTRRQMVTGPRVGPRYALLVVSAGAEGAIGVRYVEGETPAPLIVHRTRNQEATRRMIKASGGLEVRDEELARALASIQIGQYVTTDHLIQKISPMLHRATLHQKT